jgi:hypothetical protein
LYRQQDHINRRIEQQIQQNLTERHHREELEFRQVVELVAQDRIARINRQHEWEIEQHRARNVDEHRRQDHAQQNELELDAFLDQYNLSSVPLLILQPKVHSLLRRFDTSYKTLLIKILYEGKLLSVSDNNSDSQRRLSLSEADLSGIKLGNKDSSKLSKDSHRFNISKSFYAVNILHEIIFLMNETFP